MTIKSLDEMDKIYLDEAIILQSSVSKFLKQYYPVDIAEIMYQDFYDMALEYRKNKYGSMGELIKNDKNKYFRVIHESVGYAIEKMAEKYFKKKDGGGVK